MGQVKQEISAYRLVAPDTPVFIYYLENSPMFSGVSSLILATLEHAETRGLASVLSLSELSAGPQRSGDPELARVYEIRLFSFPNLHLLPVDRQIARTAAWIRGNYGFRLPDAIHLATAFEHDADTFITNDHRLQQFRELPVTLLRDFVH